jgi:lipopolysaccharide export system protein LptC
MTAGPRPELHLPDLPDVSVQLGMPGFSPAPEPSGPLRPGLSWGYRLRQALSSYLPLLLMALLAASTWWLIKHTPQAVGPGAAAPLRQTPDYTMTGFTITRFGPDGHVVLRITGDALRHFPATDRLEIEGVRIRAIAPDGRTTDASARRALANGDGSEVQLLGGAQVISQLEGADRLEVQGEFLHAFLRFERLRSHLPVRLLHGGTEAHAGSLEYDHPAQLLQLGGPVRATFVPGAPVRPTTAVPAAIPAAQPPQARP